MSQVINDLRVSVMPYEYFANMRFAAKYSYCEFDKGDGSGPAKVSAYKYLEELATNPELYSERWKTGLLSAGAGIGASTIGFNALTVLAAGPLAPFAALAAALAVRFLGNNRIATIIVCNATNGDMKLGEIHLDCGCQTGRPVYADIDLETGSSKSSKPDLIPGRTEIVPGFVQYGIGMYRFEKGLSLVIGVYGTGGAISWTLADPAIQKTMALAWLVPETGSPGLAVTADLSKYSSLKDFYDKTAGARIVDTFSQGIGTNGQETRIRASGIAREYPDKSDSNDLAITVYIE